MATVTLKIRVKKKDTDTTVPKIQTTQNIIQDINAVKGENIFNMPLSNNDISILDLAPKSGITFKVIDDNANPLNNFPSGKSDNIGSTDDLPKKVLKPMKQIKIVKNVEKNLPTESDYDILSEDDTYNLGEPLLEDDNILPNDVTNIDDGQTMVRKLSIFGTYFWVGDNRSIYDTETLEKVGIIKPNLRVEWVSQIGA